MTQLGRPGTSRPKPRRRRRHEYGCAGISSFERSDYRFDFRPSRGDPRVRRKALQRDEGLLLVHGRLQPRPGLRRQPLREVPPLRKSQTAILLLPY
uniref:Uncharacterized protein n=1 Tax=Steinernema glaseri TaxID=37863 RepID=A0A1I7Z8R6_9BILA